jgi:hypothetical protein
VVSFRAKVVEIEYLRGEKVKCSMRPLAATDRSRIVLVFYSQMALALVLALDVVEDTSAEMAARSPSFIPF